MNTMSKNRKSRKEQHEFEIDDDNQSHPDFLQSMHSTEDELRDIIAYLIQHRELMRDAELETLENNAQSLVRQLQDCKRKVMLEELRCFKDILAFHRHLMEQNDKPRH